MCPIGNVFSIYMNVFSYLLSYLAMQGGAFNVSAACAQLASVGGQRNPKP